MMRVARSAGPVLALALGTAACEANNPFYLQPMAPLEAGMDMAAGPASAAVTISFRRPTEEERASLRQEGMALNQTLPWLRAKDIAISVLYTVTNLSGREGRATIAIDGASEFASYDAAALRAAALMANPNEDDVPTYYSLIQTKPLPVPAGGSMTGTLREDDFAEAALDLDAIGRWMAEPTSVLINRSPVSRIGLEMVPTDLVVPALFQVKVSFSATTHMRLSFLVRVRDGQNVLIEKEGQGEVFAPRPPAYMPMPAMMMPAPMMMP